jgi:hypothetical protein
MLTERHFKGTFHWPKGIRTAVTLTFDLDCPTAAWITGIHAVRKPAYRHLAHPAPPEEEGQGDFAPAAASRALR